MAPEEYTIREAGEGDLREISALLRQFGKKNASARFLQKKYFENPAGLGRIFVMENANHEIKGTLGYVPHLLYSPEASPLLVMESVDLLFAPEARGKQMFVKIQGDAMKIIGAPLIAFPNPRSEEITVKLGWERLAPVENWYLALRPGFGLGKGPGSVLMGVVQSASWLYGSIFQTSRETGIELERVERFTGDSKSMKHRWLVPRSAEYLNWRYVDNPLREYLLFDFRRDGEACGYCVVCQERDTVVIYDFFTTFRERECLRMVAQHFGGRTFKWLLFRGVGLRLWRLGFVKWRSHISVISYNLPHERWVMTLGDSDW